MRKTQILTGICLWILNCITTTSAQQNPDLLFENYFKNAQTFADTYTREKAYLHFDNTSYCLGDSIWFKAYVTLAEGNRLSCISKPLYIELVDQLGNVTERQVIKLENGEGHGQIAIKTSYLPGYYEVRAYTRWMQAFDEKQCFSRTFPVYSKKQEDNRTVRSIGTYFLDKSMKQRPSEKIKGFSLRFFPEGGSMVQGVNSLVAFEAESEKNGPVPIEGTVKDKEGNILTRFRALHEGMGCFGHTPGAKPALAEIEYEGETYSFKLPEALPKGYVLHVAKAEDKLYIQVTRSAIDLQDTLALFISQQGRPLLYKRVDFNTAQAIHLNIPTQKFPEGVTQVSLITSKGETLCERLCYLMTDHLLNLQIATSSSNTKMYKPYDPIDCQLSVRDKQGKPVQTSLSVAIRDALGSDYIEFDHNIYTDQLLTSDLKGYIHQPGYYFVNKSPQRQRALDALMMVRGWKKYDMTQIIGAKEFAPIHMPEMLLEVQGQIKSEIRKKALKDIGISILINNDSLSNIGFCETDSLGFFTIPLENVEGSVTALIQTRKKDKMKNKQTSIQLLRNYSPSIRKYGYKELFPEYVDMDKLRELSYAEDSLYEDSILALAGTHALSEVVVKSKRHNKWSKTNFEQNIDAYYNIPDIVDKLRDEGKDINELSALLNTVNPNIVLKRTSGKNDSPMITTIFYNSSTLLYLVNGELTSASEIELYLERDIDGIKYILLGSGRNFFDQLHTETTAASLLDIDGVDWTTAVSQNKICAIETIDSWWKDKQHGGQLGIRRTRLQGYTKPAEFYSPIYAKIENQPTKDYRRTLYWNPNLKTNEKGEAVVNCYNANSSTFITVSAETIYNGRMGALCK